MTAVHRRGVVSRAIITHLEMRCMLIAVHRRGVVTRGSTKDQLKMWLHLAVSLCSCTEAAEFTTQLQTIGGCC